MQFDARKETSWKESRCRSCVSTGISRTTQDNGKKNCKGIAKWCKLIKMKQEKCKTHELNIKKKGVRHFTDDGRGAEITVVLVLQARAKMSENKVNAPEDAVVSDMIKLLPWEKIYIITRCIQERSMGQMDAPSSWKIVKLVFLRKPHKDQREGSEVTGPSR